MTMKTNKDFMTTELSFVIFDYVQLGLLNKMSKHIYSVGHKF